MAYKIKQTQPTEQGKKTISEDKNFHNAINYETGAVEEQATLFYDIPD